MTLIIFLALFACVLPLPQTQNCVGSQCNQNNNFGGFGFIGGFPLGAFGGGATQNCFGSQCNQNNFGKRAAQSPIAPFGTAFPFGAPSMAPFGASFPFSQPSRVAPISYVSNPVWWW